VKNAAFAKLVTSTISPCNELHHHHLTDAMFSKLPQNLVINYAMFSLEICNTMAQWFDSQCPQVAVRVLSTFGPYTLQANCDKEGGGEQPKSASRQG
jgi:hypothetical protein